MIKDNSIWTRIAVGMVLLAIVLLAYATATYDVAGQAMLIDARADASMQWMVSLVAFISGVNGICLSWFAILGLFGGVVYLVKRGGDVL